MRARRNSSRGGTRWWLSAVASVVFFAGATALFLNVRNLPQDTFVALDVVVLVVALGFFIGLVAMCCRKERTEPAFEDEPEEPPDDPPLNPRMYYSDRR